MYSWCVKCNSRNCEILYVVYVSSLTHITCNDNSMVCVLQLLCDRNEAHLFCNNNSWSLTRSFTMNDSFMLCVIHLYFYTLVPRYLYDIILLTWSVMIGTSLILHHIGIPYWVLLFLQSDMYEYVQCSVAVNLEVS